MGRIIRDDAPHVVGYYVVLGGWLILFDLSYSADLLKLYLVYDLDLAPVDGNQLLRSEV